MKTNTIPSEPTIACDHCGQQTPVKAMHYQYCRACATGHTQDSEPRASIFTIEQTTELKRLKAYFPFRIVWGAVSVNGEFVCAASTSRRELNKYVRNPEWVCATLG